MSHQITRQMLNQFELDSREQLILWVFIANNRNWVAQHVLPLEKVLRHVFDRLGMELRHLHQAEPHPVYDLSLCLGKNSASTPFEIKRAVCLAFAAAGWSVDPKYIQSTIRNGRAKVCVYVTDR